MMGTAFCTPTFLNLNLKRYEMTNMSLKTYISLRIRICISVSRRYFLVYIIRSILEIHFEKC